jgi:hypothetical protein
MQQLAQSYVQRLAQLRVSRQAFSRVQQGHGKRNGRRAQLGIHSTLAKPPTFPQLATDTVSIHGPSKPGTRHREQHLHRKRTRKRRPEPDQPKGEGLDAGSIQKQTTDQRLAGQSFGLVKALGTGCFALVLI